MPGKGTSTSKKKPQHKSPSTSNAISKYFPKIYKAPTNEDTENEEIIEASPEKTRQRQVLEEIKQPSNCSPPHSTQKSSQEKKRKGCYPDDIPDLDVQLPVRKKPCTVKEGIQVVQLADISQDEFKSYQESLEKASSSVRKIMKTPEKKKTTPKKNPSSGKKKLFEQSPKGHVAKDFKVQVLHNFIKITPSKSGSKRNEWVDMNASPPRAVFSAKTNNENTPVNLPKPSQSGNTPTSGRARVKLDFTLSKTFTTVIPTEEKTPNKEKVYNFFDDNDSWDYVDFGDIDNTLDLTVLQHCQVLAINKTSTKFAITVQSTKNKDKANCNLSNLWAQCDMEIGNTIYIQAYLKANEWYVDGHNGLIVFEPDYLLSSTTLVGGVFCKRKCVLRERFGGFSPQSKIMLIGSLVHSLLQESLKRNLKTEDAIHTLVQQLVTTKDTIVALFDSSLTVKEVTTEVQLFIPRIASFMQQYLASNAGKFPLDPIKGNWRGKIDKIQDIEENIWCPELGIKGKVDVTVKVGNALMPLELKTGRASMSVEHRGQVALYIMMMEKLGYKVTSGLLLYLREGVLREVSLNPAEKQGLILLRNEIVYYLTRQPEIVKRTQLTEVADIEDLMLPKLPPPINHHSACERCEYNVICSAALKKENYDLNSFKNLKAMQVSVVGHLSDAHIEYFAHWWSLLALESNSRTGKPVRDIYLKTAEEREKLGRCLTNMQLDGDIAECNGSYSTTFRKECSAFDTDNHSNILTGGLNESNYVIVSTRNRPAVATGIVTHVDYKSISIELDRDLSSKYAKYNFDLDTYDSNSANTFNFTNLSVLLERDERAQQLRKLIIDKEAPTFGTTMPKSSAMKAKKLLANMNKEQQRAILRAVIAHDYLLIKGMPGTGKTATLVTLVLLLIELDYSVLITSHTHSAVDNICLRLLECNVNVLRLGAASRIHPALHKCSEHYLTRNCKTPEELDKVYNSAKVLAVTCLGSKHPLLSKRTMDYCIVDESTQVLQCSVIRALHSSKKFILVGDPDQLPPVVQNREALARGLSESLFVRLQDKLTATVILKANYRMNKTITALANNLTYKGELLLANEKVGNANLRIPKYESMVAFYNNTPWVLTALDDDLSKAVFVLDTGPVWNKSYDASWIQVNETPGSEYVNPSECAIVVALTHALIKGGVSAANIGVMAPYRAQVAKIAAFLQPLGVDVSTVDQFQGKDKEIILYSCSKSRDVSQEKHLGGFEILEDRRRLTVALTRAKHKFLLVADVATVREYSPFGKLFDHIDGDCYLQLIDDSLGFNWEQVIKDCAN